MQCYPSLNRLMGSITWIITPSSLGDSLGLIRLNSGIMGGTDHRKIQLYLAPTPVPY